MYRAATWWALYRGIDLDDAQAVAETIRAMPLEIREERGDQRVIVGGHDVTETIRSPEVTRQIYRLDENPDVRKRLVQLQREFGASQPTVAEGRDIGTIVFPKARCKIYLEASLEERARRRARELVARGVQVDFDELLKEMRERDMKNMARVHSPLRPAPEAVRIDTTNMTLEEVTAGIVDLARTHL
jgi:cytidylate kinase